MESGFIAQSVLKIDKLKHLVTGGDEYVEETTIKEHHHHMRAPMRWKIEKEEGQRHMYVITS